MPVVFTVAVLNFLVGFGLAVLLQHRIVVPVPVPRRGCRNRAATPDESAKTPARLEDVRDGLPTRWLELLDSGTIQATTLMDAVLEILNVELATYREGLLKTEDHLREATTDENSPPPQDTIHLLVSLNGDWATRQKEASRVLNENRDGLGPQAPLGSQLERLLLDQIRMVHAGCQNLSHVHEGDHDSARDSVISQISHWASMAHQLRDTLMLHMITHDTSAAQHGQDGPPKHEGSGPRAPRATGDPQRHNHGTSATTSPKLESNPRYSQPDEMTGLRNRGGIELAFERWWQADPGRQRPLAAALIDLDRFGALNRQAGIRVGDRILKMFADYLTRLIGDESEWEPIYRYSGQSFFILLADSSAEQAAERIEKTRQTIAATKLDHEGRPYSLTFSAAVASVAPDEETTTTFHRLEELMKKAKDGGRNRTECEDSAGGRPAESEPPDVPAAVLNV